MSRLFWVSWVSWVSWALRLATAGGLAIDAYVHADLAARYDANSDAAISQGDLFRIEAGVSALLALGLILVANRVIWSAALFVAASALGAVLLYAHSDVGRLGPLPDMYEPIWYPEKTLSAVAEGVASGTALLGLLIGRRDRWLVDLARRIWRR